MCGIHFSASFKTQTETETREATIAEIGRMLSRRGPDQQGYYIDKSDTHILQFQGSVLQMRGEQIVKQPVVSKAGNILLWNGEIFGGLEVDKKHSDTLVLLQLLEEADNREEVCEVMRQIKGPWAFLYYQKHHKIIWFGRDYFGRRSLLWKFNSSTITISSVACQTQQPGEWTEVPGCGLFRIILKEYNYQLECSPWARLSDNKPKQIQVPGNDIAVSNKVPIKIIEKYFNQTKLFLELVPLPDAKVNMLEMLTEYSANEKILPIHEKFILKLQKAVKKRLDVCDVHRKHGVGILFSGGIDCTVLAVLAHKCLPPREKIDLINVAFKTRNDKEYSVPDRMTGQNTYAELQKLFPERDWNFVFVNVPLEELKEQRKQRIADLTYPKGTVLDDSIACAIWFAARAQGKVTGKNGLVDYTSKTRILLCGMGADEQLGGYSRHRGIFENSGDWELVDKEMQMEMERIESRNLGRDDRIIADHGKEGLFPYLDEGVVCFLSSLPVHIKTDLRLPRGLGEKILLRCVALKLGLKDVCVLPKRAIQFGSRIAKAEARKEKGSQTCTRLQQTS